jgi:hypothetical protein
MRLIEFRPFVKNTLRGFATFELPNGLRISDCTVHVSSGTPWVGLPSKPLLEEGRHKQDVNGKPMYAPVVQWRSRDLHDAFSAKALSLIRAVHPAAVDASVAP